MATLNISLPEDMKAFIEAEAARRGFGDVDAYLRSVIQDARERAGRRGRVDALLLEGLDSGPAEPLGADDWEAVRRKLEGRRAAPPEGPPHAAE